MAVNPTFSATAKWQWNTATAITVANTAMDGTGTVEPVYTASATGDRLTKIMVVARGTNVATVMRFFVNNGGSNATPANNNLFKEITCPATTLSQTAAMMPIEFPVLLDLPSGYKINVTIGTAVAAGFSVGGLGAAN